MYLVAPACLSGEKLNNRTQFAEPQATKQGDGGTLISGSGLLVRSADADVLA